MKNKDNSVNKTIKKLQSAVDRLVQTKKLEELEGQIPSEKLEEHNMLKVNTQEFDMFGDPIGMVTGSRLHGDADAWNIARAFVVGKHHNMMGNRYGKHSLLIRKEYFDEGKIDPYLLSAYPHKVIEMPVNGEMVEFYKIRMLVSDMLVYKILLTRIPTGEGLARKEEIMHIGAKNMGIGWTEEKIPVPPDYIPKGTYGKVKKPSTGEQVVNAVGSGFEEA